MNDPVFSPLTQSTNLFLDTSGSQYRIGIPLHANIAADTVGRFARNEKANHLALIHENDDGSVERYTFAELDELACRFAVFLNEIGVKQGESVAIHTAQSPADRDCAYGNIQNRRCCTDVVPPLWTRCHRSRHQ